MANIEAAVDRVLAELIKHPDVQLNDIEIALDLDLDEENDMLAAHYVCDIRKREVFWLWEVPSTFVSGASGSPVMGREHLRKIPQPTIVDYPN